MRSFLSKPIIVVLVVIVIVGAVISAIFVFRDEPEVVVPIPVEVSPTHKYSVIGTSLERRKIESYEFGDGAKHVVFVGGVHGGYEWNSVLLAYEFIDYLKENPDVIPASLKVSIIPSLNPDAVFDVVRKEGRFALSDVSKDQKVLEAARFNSNNVDLNRNFDCNWQATSTWRSRPVSAGTAPFSEPEAKALRDFALQKNPVAVIFWHSQANAVFASECNDGILPVTLDIMNVYAKAAGYQALKTFDSYKITGDAEGWLASINIPSITVELKTHETIEWEKNLAGVQAIFKYFSENK